MHIQHNSERFLIEVTGPFVASWWWWITHLVQIVRGMRKMVKENLFAMEIYSNRIDFYHKAEAMAIWRRNRSYQDEILRTYEEAAVEVEQIVDEMVAEKIWRHRAPRSN